MRRKHKRRFRKKQIIKRNIYITTSIFCLSLILTIAYSSFSTSLTLNTKGNLKEITASQYLKTKIISSGDGLYKDYTENNRYIYKGKSPNNYIKFNNELWRIISIEPDSTIKIVKDDTLGSMQFDSETNRNNDSNTYCNRENTYNNETKYYGCGVWTATTTEYSDGIYSGTVTQNATLNTYLNNEYYTALNKDTQYITTHNFNIGLIERKEQTTIEEMYNREKKQTWYGKIGLINSSDYMKASINSNYNTYGTSRQNPSPCSYENGNYLDQTKTEFWTMDRPIIVNTNTTSRANTAGYLKTGGLSSWYATATYQVRPALYLKENIKIIGAGNINNPYQIKN